MIFYKATKLNEMCLLGFHNIFIYLASNYSLFEFSKKNLIVKITLVPF
jgi:hypothetical protein